MLGYLILLFTLIPLVELAILIKVGQYIGVSSTLAIVIVTGITGAFLARLQGFIILRQIQADINQGIMPADKLFDGFLVLCGGLLLLTPGLITDILGLMVLIPYTRYLIKLWIKHKVREIISGGRIITIYRGG